MSSIKNTSLCCNDCDWSRNVRRLHSPVKLEPLEAGSLGRPWWRCCMLFLVLWVVCNCVLVVMCSRGGWFLGDKYFYRTIFFHSIILPSMVLSGQYLCNHLKKLLSTRICQWQYEVYILWRNGYVCTISVLFYLFRVNLSTQMSWNFNY